MLSEGLGKLSFWLMFVGILATFLIQHVMGLDGMPRRIYEYDNVGHLALYNQISTVGSFILAAGVLVTIINVWRSLKLGVVAGPDPWKANTLEWFTTSPPPVNNFDVDPAGALGRTDEGHPPRGRAAQRRAPAHGHASPREPRRWASSVEGERTVSPAPPHERDAGARDARHRAGHDATRARVRAAGRLPGADQAEGPVAAAADARSRRMYVAGDPSPLLVALTCLGGYLSAGGAGAVNHWFDRDIDAQMARTANAPDPRRAHRPDGGARCSGARWPGCPLLELSLAVNPLAAALSFSGFLGYVFVYTIWLKRRTPQNIVIGGAAGAVPPLVGWAAVTGSVSGTAVLLFFIVFFWTPPHFWALSLLMKDEYAQGRACRCCRSCAARPRRAGRSCSTRCCCTRSPSCRSAPGGFGAIYLVASVVLGPRLHRRRRAAVPAGRPAAGAAAVPLLAGLPGAAVLRDGGRQAPVGWGPAASSMNPRASPARTSAPA